jgi:hypothetical protein
MRRTVVMGCESGASPLKGYRNPAGHLARTAGTAALMVGFAQTRVSAAVQPLPRCTRVPSAQKSQARNLMT